MSIDPIELTQALIRCPSVTPEEAGALTVVEEALTSLGFTCHRVTFEEPEHAAVENLYARLGEEGPNLCFAGHTDVVPVGDETAWTHPPFAAEIKDDILYGRGAVDMKTAIACFIAAVSNVLAQGKQKGSISLLITGDEEGIAINGTRKMLGWLKEQNETIDACVVGEPTNPTALGEMIKIGRRGSVGFSLNVIGTQGHVAYPDQAQNPLPYLSMILHDLSIQMWDEGTEHFQPSNLEITTIDVDNTATNVIPANGQAMFNIRFNDQHSSGSIVEKVTAIIESVLEDTGITYELTPRVSGEAFLTKPGPLSDVVAKSVEKVTGKSPELSTTGGTSDARFIKDICPVVECGLINKTAHKVDECIAVADIEQLTKIYEEVIRELSS